MALHDRVSRLESILCLQAPPEWTVWEQDCINAGLFRCRQSGEVARWDDLAGRPRTTLLEYSEDHEGTGQPATIMHQPSGVTRRLVGVGRDE